MRAHVLVVDDDEEIRASLKRGLSFEGYQVTLAADGEEALRLTRQRSPDLVVLDILLPGLDGLEVCRRLRAADEALPIILLTARDAVNRARGEAQRFTDVLAQYQRDARRAAGREPRIGTPAPSHPWRWRVPAACHPSAISLS